MAMTWVLHGVGRHEQVLADLRQLHVTREELQDTELGGCQGWRGEPVHRDQPEGPFGVVVQLLGEGLAQLGSHPGAGFGEQLTGQCPVSERHGRTGLDQPPTHGEPRDDVPELGREPPGRRQGRRGPRFIGQGLEEGLRRDAQGCSAQPFEPVLVDDAAGPTDVASGLGQVAGGQGQDPLPGQGVGLDVRDDEDPGEVLGLPEPDAARLEISVQGEGDPEHEQGCAAER